MLVQDGVAAQPFGGGAERTDKRTDRAVMLDIVLQQMREKRDDDAEAHDIHEHRQEDEPEGATLGGGDWDGHAPHDGVPADLRKQNSGLRSGSAVRKMGPCAFS